MVLTFLLGAYLAITISPDSSNLGVLEPSGQIVQLGIKRVESDQSVIQQMKKEGSDSTCFTETDV
jgi:hypothetical protein